MIRQAWAEVRHHPGRFISTILAIAIAVGFLAGSSILVATEGQAQGKSMTVALANADLVVRVPDDRETPAGLGRVIAETPGVAAAAPVLSAYLPARAGDASVQLQVLNLPPEPLRWAALTAGRWPSAADEVTLSRGAAEALHVGVGATLAAGGVETLRVVGVTDEPSSLFVKTGYAAPAMFGDADATDHAAEWTIKVADPAAVAEVAQRLDQRLAGLAGGTLTAQPAAQARTERMIGFLGGLDVFGTILWGFAAVSMVIGMITIANTFSITLAQRRRQIGLLRAVGATGAQVRRRFLTESVVLGVLGSLLGLLLGVAVAVAETAWSSALYWGLNLPVGQLLVALALGVIATVAAAFVPILRGTRVAPLEALQPVLGDAQRRSARVVRLVVCLVLLVAGAGLAWLAVATERSDALLVAVGAGGLIALAVLIGGPFFVPALLRLTGGLIRRAGPVPALAAGNAVRNPARATATATALMLAVGLIVTLQVATASVRATVLDQLGATFPVDLQVAWTGDDGAPAAIPATVADDLRAVRGVTDSVLLASGRAELNGDLTVQLIGSTDAVPRVTDTTTRVADDQVLVDVYSAKELPAQVHVHGPNGTRTLTVVGSRLARPGQAVVSAATLGRIVPAVPDSVMWLSVPDRSASVSVLVDASRVVGNPDRLTGAVVEAAAYEQVLNVLLAITTALLAVAVLIALVGVSNTLGLSVLERSRESGLLRALGLQARSLRLMLLIEALQVALVGTLVGVAAGVFFGWLAITALGNGGGFDQVRFAVDVPTTLGMLALAVLTAGLASVLPGRRAARSAPTEALAEV